MVGAMSPHPSRPQIPEPAVSEFADAAADSGHGLVLSSFGSNAAFFGAALGLEDYEQLALAFADLAPVSALVPARWSLLWGATPHPIPVPGKTPDAFKLSNTPGQSNANQIYSGSMNPHCVAHPHFLHSLAHLSSCVSCGCCSQAGCPTARLWPTCPSATTR